MQTSFAVTYGAGDWATWLFLAFASGLVASFIARPQGMGCFGFGCFGNLLIGGIGAIVGNRPRSERRAMSNEQRRSRCER
ncbi:MAG: hypothetical protein LC748_07615 [Thermomicrobia bacterium]|nr:hypothetical protein [Thermomicrobia bacterium]